MTPPALPKEQKHFQLERIILFTDAVFAIAITLLIIEIKVPHIEGEFAPEKLSTALFHQLPQWIGFLVSFSVIGQYWIAHHRIFGYVHNYDKGLLFINLFFLMSIVVMPYTTALYSDYFTQDLPFFIYCINITLTGALQTALWLRISNRKRHLSYFVPQRQQRYILWRGIVVPLIFLASAALSGLSTGLSRGLFIGIFIAQWLLGRYFTASGNETVSENKSSG